MRDGIRIGSADLARRVAGWVEAAGARTRPAVVAVDGPSGAGKTGLADRLAVELREVRGPAPAAGTAVVHLDDLYPGWDGLEAVVPLLLEHVLAPLSGDAAITVPTWDWERDRAGPPRALPGLGTPRPAVVLLEGAGAGARAVAPHLAGLIWVEAPEPVRRARALARDGATYAPHWARWARQERGHFRREGTRRRADLVLVTADGGERPVVVRDAGR
ncbi:MAG: uridine kinase family protein [Kineosporiaceae bacterium]